MTLVLHPDAEIDILDAFAWYETQRTGLGRDFADAVDAAFERIVESPQRFPVAFSAMQRVVLRRFPYVIYFEAVNVAHVYGVLHGRRSRRALQQRATRP